MATLPVLLDVESEVERAFAAYLGTTLSLPVVRSDSDSTLVTPRIEIVATLNSEGPHEFTIPSGTNAGLRLYDQKSVSLQIDLIYEPGAPTSQSPGTLRGKLRQAFLNYPAIAAALATNGYYLIAPTTLQQTGGNRVANDPEPESERLSTTLTAVFFISQTALAAST